MGTWVQIGGWVCLIATVAGLALSFIAWRKRGYQSGLRGIAWSLLPAVIWLTHSVRLVGSIVSAVVQYANNFVFSPRAWFGVVVLCFAILLFLLSGGIPLVRHSRKRKPAGRAGRGDNEAGSAAPSARPEDDLSDVEEILRRRGIK